ncbi:hypothetical protein [Vibrio sp. CyArs1]|uniref:hypothetical protein n=1 Tax=Vibrio sp. CyArs1 TaxID=2682577 RepID=UPI001F068032|nr:hypothetical protein [Vibrio sp. CyArs1]
MINIQKMITAHSGYMKGAGIAGGSVGNGTPTPTSPTPPMGGGLAVGGGSIGMPTRNVAGGFNGNTPTPTDQGLLAGGIGEQPQPMMQDQGLLTPQMQTDSPQVGEQLVDLGGGGSSGSESGRTDSVGRVDDKHKQDKYYDELLGAGSGWFRGGAGEGGGGLDEMGGALRDAADHYRRTLEGGSDRSALDRANKAAADAARQNLEQNTFGAIRSAAQGSGMAASSRRGIAEGVAAGQAAGDFQQGMADREFGFQQDALRRQDEAADRLLGTVDTIRGIAGERERQSEYQRNLRHLLNYKDIISGDMGGTRDSTESTDWRSKYDDKYFGGGVGI